MKAFAIVLTAFAMSIGLSGCDAGCVNEPTFAQASPSGVYRAVVFNRNCGATTGFNTQVSIIKSSDVSLNAGGNALILDGTIPLSIRWSSDARVSITGASGAKIFKQERSVAGVEVAYE